MYPQLTKGQPRLGHTLSLFVHPSIEKLGSVPGYRDEKGSRELMSTGDDKQEVKLLQSIGTNLVLWECNKGSGNPGKQPLPVWRINGKPYVAGVHMNADLGWSLSDKQRRVVGRQRPCERKQKENKWENHMGSGKNPAGDWIFSPRQLGAHERFYVGKWLDRTGVFETLGNGSRGDRATGDRLFRISRAVRGEVKGL